MERSNEIIFAALLALTALPALAQHAGHRSPHAPHTHGAPSPYAGEQHREIKALPAAEQRGWLEGQGMGLARTAELNGYPGPMHVLELAQPLQLSAQQLQASRELMHGHKAEARALGAQLVEAERRLDLAFRERQVQESTLAGLTEEIGMLQARIRASHLRTHLAQTALLSREQVARYNELRGYTR